MIDAARADVPPRPDPAHHALGGAWRRRVCALVLSATYLWVVAILALWVLGPTVGFRWQPVMIDAGSMEPAIHPGDVVLIDTNADPTGLAPGTIITFDDPVWPDALVTHRVVQHLDDGTYRTRGDAAAVNDSTPIHPDAILGTGRLLVPYIGLPMLWFRDAPTAAAVWVLLTITAWVVVARVRDLAPLRVTRATGRSRTPSGATTKVVRWWAPPARAAGRIRQWAPTAIAAATAALTQTTLGPATVVWPLMIFLIDPCGPHVPTGRWRRAWTTGPLTRMIKPLPTGATSLAAAMVVVTLASTATFAAGSANPTNSFAAGTLAPPTNLTATGGGNVSLSWTATPDPDAAGHRVFRSTTSGGPYTQIAEVAPATTTTHVDSPADGTYYYVVQAFVAGWTSSFSNENRAAVTSVSPEPQLASWTTDTVSGVDTQEWGHLVEPGNDRLLVVSTTSKKKSAVSVTYGGVPLTYAGGQIDVGDQSRLSIWYLVNPPVGKGNVRVVYESHTEIKTAGATSWTGVDQANPLGPFTSTTDESSSASLTVSSAPGEIVLDVISGHRVGPATAGPGQTTVWSEVAGDETGAQSHESGAASVEMSWDLTTAKTWAIGAVTLRPAGGGFASFADSRSAGPNGRLDPDALIPLGGGHRLRADAAAAFTLMADALWDDLGVELADRVTDSYRTYAQQVDVANRKGLYSQGGLAAEPGTSNHGLGLAVDLDVSGGVHEWLVANAGRFGFHTIPREPWHWEFRR